MVTPRHPDRAYVHLGTDVTVTTVEVTPEFWASIDERSELHTGRLITSFEMSSDWDSWEMHPVGDEVILVTAGEVRFHLDDGRHVTHVDVAAPHYVVVPAGTWHTADALGIARLVVITWGEGTQHRAR